VAQMDPISSRLNTTARKIKNELEVTIFTDDEELTVALVK
jgi:hypothetical protein